MDLIYIQNINVCGSRPVCGHSYLPVQVSKFEVEEPTRETSKAQVGAEPCGTGQ